MDMFDENVVLCSFFVVKVVVFISLIINVVVCVVHVVGIFSIRGGTCGEYLPTCETPDFGGNARWLR